MHRQLMAAFAASSLALLCASSHGQVVNPGNGHTYVYHAGPITFQAAEAWAVSLGGHLVSINDAAEQAWLNANFPLQTWIGLTDEAVEGVWVWTSGEPVTYTHWWPNDSQPDGSGDYAWSGYGAIGWWDDHPADGNGWGAIAELPLSLDFDVQVIPPSAFNANPDVLNEQLGTDPSRLRIETFRCEGLTPFLGLSVTLGDGAMPDFEEGPGSADEAWDFNNGLWNHGTSAVTDVTFEVEGTTFFGVGVSHLEQVTSLSVNGTLVAPDITALPNFVPGGPNSKNGYLVITPTGDSLIHTVTFHSVPAGSSDSIFFDHIAWDPNPLPADLSGDGTVDGADLAILLGRWGFSWS